MPAVGTLFWPPLYSVMPLPMVTGQQTPEQLIEARKLLENLQSSERNMQLLEFQNQQLKLNLQQTQAAHAMEQQFKKSMMLQELEQTEQAPRNRVIKLALRKRLFCILMW